MNWGPDLHVYYGEGAQTIRVVAYDKDGYARVPTSATYSIQNLKKADDASDRFAVADDTAATVDATTDTTDAAAGAGTADRRRIQLDGAVPGGFAVGRYYLISDADRSEAFKLARIDGTNNDLYAEQELRGGYASGATISGLEVTGTFPANSANDTDEEGVRTPYVVVWEFNGVLGENGNDPAIYRQMLWIERSAPPQLRCTPDDLQRIDQNVAAVAGDRISLEVACERGREEIEAWMRINGESPADVSLGVAGSMAAQYRSLSLIYMLDGDLERKFEWANDRTDYYLRNLASGPDNIDVVERDRSTDTADNAPGGDAFSYFAEA